MISTAKTPMRFYVSVNKWYKVKPLLGNKFEIGYGNGKHSWLEDYRCNTYAQAVQYAKQQLKSL